jgi:glutaconate CoA-transferase, subunit A
MARTLQECSSTGQRPALIDMLDRPSAGSEEQMASEIEDLVARVPDGARLALAPDYSGCALAAVRALIRRGVRDLHLIGVPQLGFQADLLIGAGCVRSVEAAAVTLGEQGPAPRFVAAVKSGALELRDSTCPAIHAALQAAEKGLPFMPLRGVLGSDLVRHRPDWRVIDNPFAADDAILLVPAIRPDVALFHAALADRAGNVWISVRRELMRMAHAAKATLVTAEEITDDDLLADDRTAAGTIPALYVAAVAQARRGAWPVGLRRSYPADLEHLRRYAELAGDEAGFARYLDEFVLESLAAE